MEGAGMVIKADGRIFRGQWKAGNPEGPCTFFTKGGIASVLQYEAGKAEGKCTFDDGSVYDGSWVGTNRQGNGRLTKKGYSYQGEWQNDVRHGKGTETEDGYVRRGTFIHDRKVGTFLVYQVSYPDNVYTINYD